MPVVGADDEAVFTRFAHDIGYIVGIFAGDVHAKFADRVIRPLPAECFEAIPRFMHHPRQPLSAGLDETKTKLGKHLMNLAHDDVVERAYGRYSEPVEGRSDSNRMIV